MSVYLEKRPHPAFLWRSIGEAIVRDGEFRRNQPPMFRIMITTSVSRAPNAIDTGTATANAIKTLFVGDWSGIGVLAGEGGGARREGLAATVAWPQDEIGAVP